MLKTRVVISGMGVLAPNGGCLREFWSSVLACKSGIGPITRFKRPDFPVRYAGEVKDFRLGNYLNGRFKPLRLSRHAQFSLAATKMAIDHARVDPARLRDCHPLPIVIGISTSAMEVIERNEDVLVAKGPLHVSPFGVEACQPHAATCAIADFLGIRTQRTTLSSACSAGLDAVAHCAELIASGHADIAIAGGADAPITPLSMASFARAGLAPDFDLPPEQCSRPFDLYRKGGLISEGAGVVVLESLEHALQRDAFPWLEILGYGNTADDAGSEIGSGLQHSMTEALANAGFLPQDIDYINAHGPSHPVIDRVETAMIKSVFGRHAARFPVSSIKGVTGNPLAASGPLQLAACAMAMHEQRIPPTANYETADPHCDLDYVPRTPYVMSVRRAMLNMHGLGGGNSSLIVGKVDSA